MKKRKTARRPISLNRKREIAKFIIAHQHLSHRIRAKRLGIPYSTEFYIFQEMIAVYSVMMLKEDVIISLTEKSLEPLVQSSTEE